jgi:amino acid transporter
MTRLHQHCKKRRINFWGAVAIGVGGMVGGGIFAVLGLAATLAGGATPLAFLVAGVVALLTAYSYAKSSRWVAALGVFACVGALAALIGHTAASDPAQL